MLLQSKVTFTLYDVFPRKQLVPLVIGLILLPIFVVYFPKTPILEA